MQDNINPYAAPSKQPVQRESPRPPPYWLPMFIMTASVVAGVLIAAAVLAIRAFDRFTFE